jgi:ribosomal protein S27AE
MTQKKGFPAYMRSSVSPQFLTKNPIYKHIFHKCPNCNNFSLKPTHMDRIKDLASAVNSNNRQCAKCGYTHVRDLSVTTMKGAPNPPVSDTVKEGRILES